jgi:AcrR family transcriptional regulator
MNIVLYNERHSFYTAQLGSSADGPVPEFLMGQRAPLLRERMRDAAADAMLEAAEKIMREKGFTGATMQDIAVAAGCAVGTLYLYFKNKDEILRGIILKHGVSLKTVMHAAIEQASDPLEKLRIFITSHLEWSHRHPEVADILCNAMPLRYYDFQAALRRLVPEEHVKMQEVELGIIREAQSAGRIRRDIPAATLAELVDGFMFTVMDQFSARPHAYSLPQQLALTWKFLTTGLEASGPERRNPQPKKKHI